MTRAVKDVEIKTLSKGVTNAVVDLGLGAVPSGMKRWVTFVKLTNEHSVANSIYICSGLTATDAAIGNAKDVQALGDQYDTLAWPDSPRPNAPLFNIAGNRYLTMVTTAGTTRVFMQYYDE